jgi:2-polyprenyl-3-methyl-5-hydroxy-6-metoxy-1,4-benzoquinol methylase
MEYRRFQPGESTVSTFAYHEHRDRAPHLEQADHRERLEMARNLVVEYALRYGRGPSVTDVVDLGCGDGGLLQLLKRYEDGDPKIHAIGYDFTPANAVGRAERGVDGQTMDFIEQWEENIELADLYVLTEVLEHLEDPHEMVRRVAERGAALVCSSPWVEHEGSIDASHAWAWDMPGYVEMIENSGLRVVRSERVTWAQVHLAVPR